jgi:hypothetical protein
LLEIIIRGGDRGYRALAVTSCFGKTGRDCTEYTASLYLYLYSKIEC